MTLRIALFLKMHFFAIWVFLPSNLGASGVEEISEASPLWTMFLSLSLVLILIPVLLFLYKKLQSFQIRSGKSVINIISVQSLGTKEKLVMVEVENQKMLLGVTAGSITKLKEFNHQSSFSELIEEENRHQNTLNEKLDV
ncbi:flagellar biosynthetic protein FliO [Marinomonas sp. 2405UD68-3]|uniref:flagellar biosynthetic protein FliO n=1 Tax=Marinomonas sp. 2405UD68-3 TaxID=3391835 RepID=UPI0039C9479C